MGTSGVVSFSQVPSFVIPQMQEKSEVESVHATKETKLIVQSPEIKFAMKRPNRPTPTGTNTKQTVPEKSEKLSGQALLSKSGSIIPVPASTSAGVADATAGSSTSMAQQYAAKIRQRNQVDPSTGLVKAVSSGGGYTFFEMKEFPTNTAELSNKINKSSSASNTSVSTTGSSNSIPASSASAGNACLIGTSSPVNRGSGLVSSTSTPVLSVTTTSSVKSSNSSEKTNTSVLSNDVKGLDTNTVNTTNKSKLPAPTATASGSTGGGPMKLLRMIRTVPSGDSTDSKTTSSNTINTPSTNTYTVLNATATTSIKAPATTAVVMTNIASTTAATVAATITTPATTTSASTTPPVITESKLRNLATPKHGPVINIKRKLNNSSSSTGTGIAQLPSENSNSGNITPQRSNSGVYGEPTGTVTTNNNSNSVKKSLPNGYSNTESATLLSYSSFTSGNDQNYLNRPGSNESKRYDSNMSTVMDAAGLQSSLKGGSSTTTTKGGSNLYGKYSVYDGNMQQNPSYYDSNVSSINSNRGLTMDSNKQPYSSTTNYTNSNTSNTSPYDFASTIPKRPDSSNVSSHEMVYRGTTTTTTNTTTTHASIDSSPQQQRSSFPIRSTTKNSSNSSNITASVSLDTSPTSHTINKSMSGSYSVSNSRPETPSISGSFSLGSATTKLHTVGSQFQYSNPVNTDLNLNTTTSSISNINNLSRSSPTYSPSSSSNSIRTGSPLLHNIGNDNNDIINSSTHTGNTTTSINTTGRFSPAPFSSSSSTATLHNATTSSSSANTNNNNGGGIAFQGDSSIDNSTLGGSNNGNSVVSSVTAAARNNINITPIKANHLAGTTSGFSGSFANYTYSNSKIVSTKSASAGSANITSQKPSTAPSAIRDTISTKKGNTTTSSSNVSNSITTVSIGALTSSTNTIGNSNSHNSHSTVYSNSDTIKRQASMSPPPISTQIRHPQNTAPNTIVGTTDFSSTSSSRNGAFVSPVDMSGNFASSGSGYAARKSPSIDNSSNNSNVVSYKTSSSNDTSAMAAYANSATTNNASNTTPNKATGTTTATTASTDTSPTTKPGTPSTNSRPGSREDGSTSTTSYANSIGSNGMVTNMHNIATSGFSYLNSQHNNSADLRVITEEKNAATAALRAARAKLQQSQQTVAAIQQMNAGNFSFRGLGVYNRKTGTSTTTPAATPGGIAALTNNKQNANHMGTDSSNNSIYNSYSNEIVSGFVSPMLIQHDITTSSSTTPSKTDSTATTANNVVSTGLFATKLRSCLKNSELYNLNASMSSQISNTTTSSSTGLSLSISNSNSQLLRSGKKAVRFQLSNGSYVDTCNRPVSSSDSRTEKVIFSRNNTASSTANTSNNQLKSTVSIPQVKFLPRSIDDIYKLQDANMSHQESLHDQYQKELKKNARVQSYRSDQGSDDDSSTEQYTSFDRDKIHFDHSILQ